jgi:hypothetical protein
MKKIVTMFALALFLGASVIGCSGSSSSPAADAGKKTPPKVTPDETKKKKMDE